MQLVLTYHRIVEGSTDAGDFFDVCAADFERHLDMTQAIWHHALSPRDLAPGPAGPSTTTGYVITFDDGTVDHFTIAAPILERCGLRGVFFVNPGELGRPGHMTLQQCQALQARGHFIESHSYDHVILTHVTDDELQRQLVESRRQLRGNGLGTHDFIAVPGGFFDDRVCRAAAAAGYRLLRTLAWGYNRRADPLRVESITLNRQTAGRCSRALLSPRGEALKKGIYKAKELVKRTGPYLYFPLRNSGAARFLPGSSRGDGEGLSVMKQSIRSLMRLVWSPALERGLRQAHYGYQVRQFKPYVKRIVTADVNFEFLIADPASRAAYDEGDESRLTPDMHFIRDHCVNEGDVIFDCGAHHGVRAIPLSKWAGETGAVLAFEPIPQDANTIRTNIELNHIYNIVVEEKALGDSDGWAFFNLASKTRITDPVWAQYRVAMTHLDAYAHLKPHFLLIDVDGYELDVLRGAQEILERHPKLLIGIYPNKFPAPARAVQDVLSLIDVDAYDTWIQSHPQRAAEPYRRGVPITNPVLLYAIPRDREVRPAAPIASESLTPQPNTDLETPRE